MTTPCWDDGPEIDEDEPPEPWRGDQHPDDSWWEAIRATFCPEYWLILRTLQDEQC